MTLKSYRELIVWQKGTEFVLEIYRLTEQFPRDEIYGLTSQMRRASVSTPDNIAEGSRRGTKKDYRNFLLNSFASGAEPETHIILSKQLPFGKKINFEKADSLLEEIMKMLNKLITQLSE